MWITIITSVMIRVPLAYGLVYFTRSMGMPVLRQEEMIFISLLAIWLIGAVMTVVVYYRGKWREKIPVYQKQD